MPVAAGIVDAARTGRAPSDPAFARTPGPVLHLADFAGEVSGVGPSLKRLRDEGRGRASHEERQEHISHGCDPASRL